MSELGKKRQKRTIIIVLALCVMALGLLGWFISGVNDGSVYKAAPESSSIRSKEYKDTASFYALEYPITFSFEQAADCCEGPPSDWTKVSRPVTFRAPNYPNDNTLVVQADSTAGLSTQITDNWASNYHEPTELSINGQSAKYVRVEYTGDAESYVDHNYLITNAGGGSVFASFRERYQHYDASWDASGNVADFDAVVKSIKLL